MSHSGESQDGLEAVFLANRETLLRFLRARGAGEDAEDVLQDVWLKISRARTGPVASPLAYLYRAANASMIDRYRAARQAQLRDAAWSEGHAGTAIGVSDSPSAERVVAGRQLAQRVEEALAQLPPRATSIFRRSRIDGVAQRVIAEEFGVSISTVESDLRRVYKALIELREQLDEE